MVLKKWLAKAGMGLEEAGPKVGEMGRLGAELMGAPDIGRRIGEASVRHPRSAGALGLAGALGGTFAAQHYTGKGAKALDSMTINDEPMSEYMQDALRESGQNPHDFHDTGIHPASGALNGAGLGALIGSMKGNKGKALLKYLAIGGAAGGALGGLARTYEKEDRK